MSQYVIRGVSEENAHEVLGEWLERGDQLAAIYVDRKVRGGKTRQVGELDRRQLDLLVSPTRILDEVIEGYAQSGGTLQLRALFLDEAGQLDQAHQLRCSLPLVLAEGARQGGRAAGGGGDAAIAHLGRSVSASLDQSMRRLETSNTQLVDVMTDHSAATVASLRDAIASEQAHSQTVMEQAITIQALESDRVRVEREYEMEARIVELERGGLLDAVMEDPAKFLDAAQPIIGGIGAALSGLARWFNARSDYYDQALAKLQAPAVDPPPAVEAPA